MALTVFCDTSVLVPALLENHIHYLSTFPLIDKIVQKKIEGVVSTHSLAECFSTLTKLRDLPPMSPREAAQVIDGSVRKFFRVVDSKEADYDNAIQLMAEKNLKGSLIYDALILQIAARNKVSRVVTWDEQDFSRLAPAGIQIVTPLFFEK